jgi:DnaD/phage-associated family protein
LSRKIFRYTVDGKNIIQIIKWWNYQTPAWATPSKFPPPINWTDRVRVHVSGNKVQTINWDKPGGYPTGYVDNVPTPIEDVNGEGNVNGNGEEEATLPPMPNAYDIYEANIGQITPFIADGVDNWLKTYPAEWIPEAIDEAVKNSARNFKYCDAILKRWAKEGFKSEKKPQAKPANNSGILADLKRLQNEASYGN